MADMVPRGPLPTRRPLAAREPRRQGQHSPAQRPRAPASSSRKVLVVAAGPRPTSWAPSRRHRVWGTGPRGSMGRSPPLGAARTPARRPRPQSPGRALARAVADLDRGGAEHSTNPAGARAPTSARPAAQPATCKPTRARPAPRSQPPRGRPPPR